MQAIKFLNTLIEHKNFRDDEWVELKWNAVIADMWRGFRLNKAEIDEVKEYMQRQREAFINEGQHMAYLYECESSIDGWDVHRYIQSVENTFDRIDNLLGS